MLTKFCQCGHPVNLNQKTPANTGQDRKTLANTGRDWPTPAKTGQHRPRLANTSQQLQRMPNLAKNHKESRKAVCILCLKKGKENLSSTVQHRIRSFLSQDIDFEDPHVPSGICTACHISLTQKEKSFEGDQVVLPKLHDFSKVFVPRFLRSSPFSCNCMICKIARSGSLQSQSKAHPLGSNKKKRGRPSSSKEQDQLKQCPKCLSTVAKGKHHSCSSTTLAKNLAKSFPEAVEKAAISVIKNKKPSPGGTVRLSQLSGPLFPVVPGTSTSVQEQVAVTVSTAALIGIQNQTSLSNNKVRQLASYLNTVVPKVKVEKNFQQNFAEQGKILEKFFTSTKDQLMKKEDFIDRDVVYCPNLEELVWFILDQRRLAPPESLIKISLDGGGSFFKVCLQVVNLSNSSPEAKRGEYLSTGVKKIFIIAIVEDISETFYNISQILGLIKTKDILHLMVCDLKVANILCGLQGHASKHPCCFCEVAKESLHQDAAPRTLGSLRKNFEAYKSSGKPLAADFQNCIHEPIFSGSDETEILDVLVPPELHLLLGIVNHLFQGMKRIWNAASTWPQKLHISTSPYHGSENFNGPACHKLLQNIDQLELLVQNSSSFQVQPFIQAFRDFRMVVHSSFGMSLDNNFFRFIRNFKESCEHLPVTITPKLHILFFHVPEFIRRKNMPLGVFSEQASESVHQDFQKFWDTRYKRAMGHPEYSNKLLKSIVEYNSKHI